MENETGKVKNKNKWLWWVLGIAGFFLIVGACSNSGNKPSSTNSGPGKVEEVNKPAAEEAIPEPEVIKLSGTGQQASQKFNLESGLSIFHMTHTGKSNFSITLMNDTGDNIELLVNEIGTFDGSKAVGIARKGEYVLDVSASGKWTVEIEQPRPSAEQSDARTFTGTGQQVSSLIKLDKGLKTFKMRHSGKSNFAVVLMDRKGNNVELLANEIGTFDGSKAVGINRSDLYLLDIAADGEWSISVE